MKLIKNNQPDTQQFRVSLNQASQNTFGHHFNAGAFADLLLTANAVAHPFTHRFTQLLRHVLSRAHRREASWFQHQDTAFNKSSLHHR